MLSAPEPTDRMAALQGVSGYFELSDDDDDEFFKEPEPAPVLQLTAEQGDALAAEQMPKVINISTI